jgi:hypothetical protein
MMKLLTVMAGIVALVCVDTSAALAKKAFTIGPFSDTHVKLPFDFTDFGYHTQVGSESDFVMVNPCPQCIFTYRQIRAVTYLTSGSGDFSKGNVVFTTIYGYDLNPDGEDLVLTGYTAGAPEVDYYGDELIGKSRKIYKSSPAEVIAISDLAARLGPGFDLSPFQGDPSTVVYLFQTKMPAKDEGQPIKGVILAENFSGAFHVGYEDPGGSFDLGVIAGTQLTVTDGNVDILGVQNGTANGTCQADPSGNCLDLIGDMGRGAVQSLANYTLDPSYTYTIEFNVDTGDLGGGSTLDFMATLGSFAQKVTATSTSQKIDLYYTPTSSEPNSPLGFMSITNVDGLHGPVLSGIELCAHPIKTKNLRCTK